MSGWQTTAAAANAVMQNAFGEPAVYQPVEAGLPVGAPVTITVVRHARVREESGAMANLEEISVNPVDLAAFPQRGDQVAVGDSQFVVASVRQPDPYGMVQLTLMVRSGQLSSD
jgi:hypothetical protein